MSSPSRHGTHSSVASLLHVQASCTWKRAYVTSRHYRKALMRMQLLEAGNTVVATCRSPSKADALHSLASSHQGRLHILPLDVMDEASVQVMRVSKGKAPPSMMSSVFPVFRRTWGRSHHDPGCCSARQGDTLGPPCRQQPVKWRNNSLLA